MDSSTFAENNGLLKNDGQSTNMLIEIKCTLQLTLSICIYCIFANLMEQLHLIPCKLKLT